MHPKIQDKSPQTQHRNSCMIFEVPQISLFALVELRVAYIEARRVGNVILEVPPARSDRLSPSLV